DTQRDVKVLRLDEAEVMRIEAACNSGYRRAKRERGDLDCSDVETHEIGHDLIVMHRSDDNSETSREQEHDEHDDKGGKCRNGRQANKRGHWITGRAANNLNIENCRLDDLPECKGRKRQVNAARA